LINRSEKSRRKATTPGDDASKSHRGASVPAARARPLTWRFKAGGPVGDRSLGPWATATRLRGGATKGDAPPSRESGTYLLSRRTEVRAAGSGPRAAPRRPTGGRVALHVQATTRSRAAADLLRDRRASILASVHRVPTAGAAPRPSGHEPMATGSSSIASSARLFPSGNSQYWGPGTALRFTPARRRPRQLKPAVARAAPRDATLHRSHGAS
jgi:hypothetical protein